MSHFTIRRTPALAAAVLLAAFPGHVLASGFQLIEQNGSGLGNAFAGQAAGVGNASAIFFNPAALTDVAGKQFLISVEPIGVSTTFADSASGRPAVGRLVLPVPLGTNGGDAGKWIPVPNGYFSWQAGKTVWVGLGVNAPFGLTTEWTTDWIGRFHAVKSTVTTLNINPTVAVKLGESFSIGAGANYQRMHGEFSQNVAYGVAVGGAAQVPAPLQPLAAAAIIAQLGGPAGLAKEGLATIEGDDWAWGWNVGALAKLGENGRLGVSYRSKISHELAGTATFVNAPTFQAAGPLAPLFAGLNAKFANDDINAPVDLPDTFSAAASWHGPKVEVLADWTWTGWSSIQALAVTRADGSAFSDAPLKFVDTWRAGLGVNVKLNDTAKLRLGAAYDKTPVQDLYRTPRLPDADRIWAATGLEWKVGKNGAFDIGYAHLFLKDAESQLPNQDTPTSTPAGDLKGTYNANVNIVSVQYRISF